MKMRSGSVVRLRSSVEDNLDRTKTRLKTCEKELVDARKIIDDTSKESARLEVESSQIRKELEDTKDKLDEKINEIARLRRDVDALRQQLEMETLKSTRDESPVEEQRGAPFCVVKRKREVLDEELELESAAEHFKTMFFNEGGDEQAIRETRHLQVSRKRKRLGFGQPEEEFQQEGSERVERERCVIL